MPSGVTGSTPGSEPGGRSSSLRTAAKTRGRSVNCAAHQPAKLEVGVRISPTARIPLNARHAARREVADEGSREAGDRIRSECRTRLPAAPRVGGDCVSGVSTSAFGPNRRRSTHITFANYASVVKMEDTLVSETSAHEA